MEYRYEDQSPAGSAAGKKPFIDFYRQTEQQVPVQGADNRQLNMVREGQSQGHNGYTNGVGPQHSENLKYKQQQDYEHKFFSQTRSDNFVDTQGKQPIHDMRRDDYKKLMQDKQAVALKRRSVESGETLLHNRQIEGHHQRQILNQPKSALGTYPTQHANPLAHTHSGAQTLKQINKNKIERDYVMDNALTAQQPQEQHQQLFQNQAKRTLAKTQSQNRLVLVSPESMMNKGQHYQDMYIIAEGMSQEQPDKNSFSDKDRSHEGNPTGQDPLFKQHLQYQSHNHQLKAWQLKAQSHILSHLSSTKDCTFCNKTGGIHSHSYIPVQQQCTSMICGKDSLGMMIQNDLSKKYSTNRDYYNLKIVNDLIYNENTHIVSIFKDYLILDDINEFLKRSYTQPETKVRLPKLCIFYDKYSQVFPNYVILPESKYMFKNIQRKQKLIDEQYQLQEEVLRRQKLQLLDEDRLFNSRFYNSVYKLDISMSRQQYEDQAKTISQQAGRPSKIPMRIDQMRMDELVDRFLLKDSESNIQLMTTAGLDFSGFTHQSTFIQDKPSTPNKKPATLNSNKQSTVQQIQSKVQQSRPMGGGTAVGQRKESVQKKPITMVPNQPHNKKQKVSFNNPQQKTQVPKLDTMKATISNISGSTKTTPRLQKPQVDTNEKHLIQTSPATKEALAHYLQQCQIDQGIDNLQIEVLDGKYDSPSIMQSPQITGAKLLAATSQTALSQQLSSSLSANNRQMMKSQCIIPTIQLGANKEITNLKKTTRLSGGNHGQQAKPTPMQKKQNISPMPITNLQAQQLSAASRNIITNSTQKSLKSVNSHAKYLSGGADQYQKLLQNPYATSDTLTSNNFNSSSKKLQPQRSKQELLETFQSKQIQPPEDTDAITGEDCDDGIADERFASPDMFATQDDNGQRKSILQRQQATTGFGNPILLTSCEDNRLLSQCNNYDQIKKHLEQYITTQNDGSTHKKYVHTMSSEKYQFEQEKGYNRTNMAQSANEANNSRNGTSHKHVESIKEKIRGVFDVDSSASASANKTPNKSSTISKRSQITVNQQPTIISNNRMSIESKDMMQLMAATQNPGCLSSTSAAGRTLSFAQFNTNQNNYRSITNMQQRKNSHTKQESSVESKRLSQNRQSFKEQQEKMKRCATGKTLSINDVNQQTFGTINTGYLQQMSSTTTLCNPTFISSTSNQQANKMYQTHHQQQNSISNSQQAANTVRVMTPSYSLASLSKIISPTQSTSPITMTVTLATQGRKQNMKKPMNQHQHNPSMGTLVTSASHQNFLLADKNSKMISSKQQPTQSLTSKSTRNIIASKPQQQIQQKTIQTRLQQSNSQEQFQITPRGIQPPSQQLLPKPQQEMSNLSCTISTENNSTAKAVESKHPKFMRTIEEYSLSNQPPQYNNMLSASMGHRKSGTGLSGSISQAQLDMKSKQKIQTVVNSNQASIKRAGQNQMAMTLTQSASVSHFKSPSQQLQTKKQQVQGRYMNM